ncbi:hypothetical protein ACE6H2_007155 [Prunus campanulata]
MSIDFSKTVNEFYPSLSDHSSAHSKIESLCEVDGVLWKHKHHHLIQASSNNHERSPPNKKNTTKSSPIILPSTNIKEAISNSALFNSLTAARTTKKTEGRGERMGL